MKRPLVLLTSLFCAGIIFSCASEAHFAYVFTASIIFWILGLASLSRKYLFSLWIAIHVFLLGASVYTNHCLQSPRHISRIVCPKTQSLCSVKGFLAEQTRSRRGKTCFLFDTYEIAFSGRLFHCQGRILVCATDIQSLVCNQELCLTGTIYAPLAHTPSSLCILNVKRHGHMSRLENTRRLRIGALSERLRKRITAVFSRHTSSTASAMLQAMVLGEKSRLSPFIYDSMIKSGTVHILVVSGFNVGLVTFIIMLTLKLLRIPRKIRICLAIPLLLLYCLLAHASTPVVRATVMAITFLLAYFLKKEPDIYTSLALAALCILIAEPAQIFDIGFQLSFSSVIAIVWLYPKLKKRCALERLRLWWLRFMIEGLCVSSAAWMGTMGFIAFYFRIFSPISIVANIFIVPLASMLTFCGFSMLAAEIVAPGLTGAIAASCEVCVLLLLKINSLLTGLPGAYVCW